MNCSGSGPTGGAGWDYYGNYDEIAQLAPDRTTNDWYHSGAVIYDYTIMLVHGLAIDQLLTWTPGAPGSYDALGNFAHAHTDYQDPTNSFDASGQISIDWLTVRVVPEPATLALLGLGFLGLGFSRRKHKAVRT